MGRQETLEFLTADDVATALQIGRKTAVQVMKRLGAVSVNRRGSLRLPRSALFQWMAKGEPLRRTFASWLVQAGESSFVVAQLLGHSSSTMVERVYGRLAPATLRAAVSKLPQR